MGEEYIGKSFKSGNSVAIRIPAALGVEPDREWTIEQIGAELRLRLKRSKGDRIDLSGVYGRGAGLKPIKSEDRVFEERELDWTGERLKRRD